MRLINDVCLIIIVLGLRVGSNPSKKTKPKQKRHNGDIRLGGDVFMK
jgi:hypothetical protein